MEADSHGLDVVLVPEDPQASDDEGLGAPLRGRIPDLVENLRPQLRRGRRQRSDG